MACKLRKNYHFEAQIR